MDCFIMQISMAIQRDSSVIHLISKYSATQSYTNYHVGNMGHKCNFKDNHNFISTVVQKLALLVIWQTYILSFSMQAVMPMFREQPLCHFAVSLTICLSLFNEMILLCLQLVTVSVELQPQGNLQRVKNGHFWFILVLFSSQLKYKLKNRICWDW